ncbi:MULTISPECIES: hypothetical protein [unclassified Pseudobutyrivibrio]|uniref:hypothetical protein n=1 Tax=unclassified Pseudobutyrivibrio TaxID=2638619 RepID=UPI000B31CE02|nr:MULTISPECIES: hypothetical protein [unclassified Pseudobutyrivibrio]
MRSRNATSPTRQGVAAKELQAARRKKRQREVMRNRIIFGVICAALLALLVTLVVKFGGALIASGGAADKSTITFTQDGQVVFEEVTDFDTQTYSKAEFKKYTQNLIKDFNESYGSKSISLKRITFRKGQVYVKTTYKDAECYAAFSSYSTYNGSYEGAVTAGYDFNETFSIVDGTSKATGQTMDADSTFAGSKVAIVKENVNVVVPGKITYVSDTSTEVLDDHTVGISQADGNNDATDLVYIVYTAK